MIARKQAAKPAPQDRAACRALALAIGIATSTAGACASPEPRPPVARIRLDPTHIPFGEPTSVTLDGSTSRDDLDDPTAPIGFIWSWDDEGAQIEEGDVNSEVLRVRFTGSFAATISLDVVDGDGHAGTVFARLGLTLPE